MRNGVRIGLIAVAMVVAIVARRLRLPGNPSWQRQRRVQFQRRRVPVQPPARRRHDVVADGDVQRRGHDQRAPDR